jgi:hypothetical protein
MECKVRFRERRNSRSGILPSCPGVGTLYAPEAHGSCWTSFSVRISRWPAKFSGRIRAEKSLGWVASVALNLAALAFLHDTSL